MTCGKITHLRSLLEKATKGPWGLYGSPVPTQGSIEAAPGLSIGSTEHTEPIARLNGYLLPVEANAELILAMHRAMPALLDCALAAEQLALPASFACSHEYCNDKAPEWDEPCAFSAMRPRLDALLAALARLEEAEGA